MNRNIFPNRCESGHTETWILGGEKNSNINDLTDEKILSMILNNRKKLFSLSEKPNEYVINRRKNAIPHYTIELESFLNNKNLNRDNLFVTGNYLGQIGLSGILENNYKLADKINKRYENA
jgi:protoporphyrinogen oxidase